jgi:inorganic pyrophosphatase
MHSWLVLIFSILLVSCRQDNKLGIEPEASSTNQIQEGYQIKLLSKAGELFEGNDFLPLPINHGFICGDLDSLDVLVLSKSIKEDKAFVKPLAYFEVYQDGEKRKFVLATPSDTSYIAIPELSFDNFMVKYYSVKVILDLWFSNFKGISETKTSNWKNNYYAEDLLNKYKTCQ